MPFMAFAMRYPVWVVLVCSVVFLGFSGAAAEPLLLPPEAATVLDGLEFSVVLALLFVMDRLVGFVSYDGS